MARDWAAAHRLEITALEDIMGDSLSGYCKAFFGCNPGILSPEITLLVLNTDQLANEMMG